MAKKLEKETETKTKDPAQPVKVLRLIRDNFGAYGFEVYEVPESALGPAIEKSLPDIFAIFVNTFIKKSREIFGI